MATDPEADPIQDELQARANERAALAADDATTFDIQSLWPIVMESYPVPAPMHTVRATMLGTRSVDELAGTG